jgi:hypothetical protein
LKRVSHRNSELCRSGAESTEVLARAISPLPVGAQDDREKIEGPHSEATIDPEVEPVDRFESTC